MAKTADELKQLAKLAWPSFQEALNAAHHESEGHEGEHEEDEDLPDFDDFPEEIQNAWCLFIEKILENQHHTVYRDTSINRGF